MYHLVETFLINDKGCFEDYVGSELSFGRFRADVFGVSYDSEKKSLIYLLEGKNKLDGRDSFSKVILETIPLKEYAEIIYVFGRMVNNFEENNIEYIEECKSRGIGILLIDENKVVYEYLEAKKNEINSLSKKESIFRIFNCSVNKPIADFIFQAAYEYIKYTNEKCVKYIDIYNALLPNGEYKEILNKILKGKHVLNAIGMRQAFEVVYGSSYYVTIIKGGKRIKDQICLNNRTMEKIKPPILLDK